MKQLDEDLENILKEKFDILLITNTLEFDHNYSILIDNVKKIKKDHFSNNERIIIEFFDTEYYDKDFLKTGLIIKNILEVFIELDISFYFLIFITSNFNLDNEINYILSCKNIEDRPTVIKTLFSRLYYKREFSKNIVADESKIERTAISMNNVIRNHRTAIFNFVKKHNLFKQIAISYRVKK